LRLNIPYTIIAKGVHCINILPWRFFVSITVYVCCQSNEMR